MHVVDSQSAFTCSKLSIETLEQGMKSIQNNKDTRTTPLAPCSGVSIVNFEQVNANWVALHTRYNALSSGKHSLSAVICKISATHRLNNIAPNIGTCGTPISDVKRLEKCPSICTKCCRKN